MANNIELRKAYTQNLDEVYKIASITARLDGPSDLAREGANANELLIPKMDMDGLADYDKANGYAAGYVDYEFQTKKITYDRGRRFDIDAVDNMDTLNQAFGRLAGEFMRTKVVPELDSYRLAQYAQKAGNGEKKVLDTGRKAINALRKAITTMKEKEVNMSDCTLYINPIVKGLIEDMDSLTSRKVMEGWAAVIEVPTSRFHTKITLGSNGYTIPNDSEVINFEIIAKKAVIQFTKHDVPKIINPEKNQKSDGYAFMYRTVGIAEVYDNKADGIYVCSVPNRLTGHFDKAEYTLPIGVGMPATFTYTPSTVDPTTITFGLMTPNQDKATITVTDAQPGEISLILNGVTEGYTLTLRAYAPDGIGSPIANAEVNIVPVECSFDEASYEVLEGETVNATFTYTPTIIDPDDFTISIESSPDEAATCEVTSSEPGEIVVTISGVTAGSCSIVALNMAAGGLRVATADISVESATPLISINAPDTIQEGQTATAVIEYDESIDPNNITVTSSDDTVVEVV